MDRTTAKEFIARHKNTSFFQPIVFVPNVIEIQGKWHAATKELASMVLKDVKNKSVLDLGCSYGYFLHEAIRRGASEARGIDHDIIVLDLAQEINDIFNDGSIIEQADINDYCPSHKYDIIVLLSVIGVLKKPEEMIKKYLSLSSELIIEHDEEHLELFKDMECSTIKSPRAAGQKLLTRLVF